MEHQPPRRAFQVEITWGRSVTRVGRERMGPAWDPTPVALLVPVRTSNSSQKPALAVSSDSCFLFSSKTRFSMSAAFTLVA